MEMMRRGMRLYQWLHLLITILIALALLKTAELACNVILGDMVLELMPSRDIASFQAEKLFVWVIAILLTALLFWLICDYLWRRAAHLPLAAWKAWYAPNTPCPLPSSTYKWVSLCSSAQLYTMTVITVGMVIAVGLMTGGMLQVTMNCDFTALKRIIDVLTVIGLNLQLPLVAVEMTSIIASEVILMIADMRNAKYYEDSAP